MSNSNINSHIDAALAPFAPKPGIPKCSKGHAKLMAEPGGPYVCTVCASNAADNAEESILERFSGLDPATRACALQALREALTTRARAAYDDMMAAHARGEA